MTKTEEPAVGSILRPRARLLRTLGEELISNEVVAVIELVKNAYDADATHILIRFIGPIEVGKGRIEVIDNGHGMDLKTVQTVWMEPATSSKREKLWSNKFKRRHLGEKGIGRFASSRLANELEVVSRYDGNEKEAYAIFDWRQFEDDNKYLDEVLILWEERNPIDIHPGGEIDLLWKNEKKLPQLGDRKHGTILRMTELKQKWEGKQFESLRRGLARLIAPKTARDQNLTIELDLPEEFSQYGNKVEFPEILKHPHYTVKGNITIEGNYDFTCEVRDLGQIRTFSGKFARVADAKGRYEVRGIENQQLPENAQSIICGPLDFELKVWDRDDLGNVIQKTNSSVQDVRRDLDAVAGINIYRDGFRVLPYGEPFDDSFRLDRRRVQNPTLRLSNNQIYGSVNISADSNPDLKDQSNRQGMQENQAFEDFRGIVYFILSKLEEMRWTAKRPPKGSTGAKKPVGGLFDGFNLKPLTDYLSSKLPDDDGAKKIVENTETAFNGQLREIQSVLSRYQRLATLGQLIDHVLHEGRQPIASINNEADLGIADIQRSIQSVGDLGSKVLKRFKHIRKQGDVIATAFRRMEPFGGRRRGRPAKLYLEEIIRDAFNVFEKDIERLNIKTSLPQTETLVSVDPSELQEVFINFVQNSLHWLEQTPADKRMIIVSVTRKAPNHLEIMFSDSGPGVPAENRDLIFEPYFSTRSEGVGLGLSIVGEIVTDYYGGSLELLNSGPLAGVNFLVTLRKRV